jgi:hypothetical protein
LPFVPAALNLSLITGPADFDIRRIVSSISL